MELVEDPRRRRRSCARAAATAASASSTARRRARCARRASRSSATATSPRCCSGSCAQRGPRSASTARCSSAAATSTDARARALVARARRARAVRRRSLAGTARAAGRGRGPPRRRLAHARGGEPRHAVGDRHARRDPLARRGRRERPTAIDRLLQQLRAAGKLARLAGLGVRRAHRLRRRPLRASRRRRTWSREILGRAAACRSSPACPFGHGRPNLAWPVGARAAIDGERGELELLEAGVTVSAMKARLIRRKLAKVDSALDKAIEAAEIPGAVVLARMPRDGEMLEHLSVRGHAVVRPERIPMARETIFDLASLTKVIATTTRADAARRTRARVDLDAPVAKYLPALRASASKEARDAAPPADALVGPQALARLPRAAARARAQEGRALARDAGGARVGSSRASAARRSCTSRARPRSTATSTSSCSARWSRR